MRNVTSEGNKITDQQSRACAEVTQGLEKEIDNLHVLSVRKRVFEVLFFTLLYLVGLSIALLFGGETSLMLIAILCMGLAFNALPILVHEGLHGLLAKNDRVNAIVTFLFGLPIVVSASAYRVTHANHHVALGRKLDYGTYGQYTSNPFLVWIAYFTQLFAGSFLYMVFIPFLGFWSASKRTRLYIVIEYILIISTFVLFFRYVPSDVILMYWFYPLLVMNIFTNIRGVASHALGNVENIYLSSRTISCSHVTALLFLHGNYHVEHHLFQKIPSYNLPKTHSLIWDRLPEALYDTSYLHFLFGMVKAASKGSLEPMGIVYPSKNISS